MAQSTLINSSRLQRSLAFGRDVVGPAFEARQTGTERGSLDAWLNLYPVKYLLQQTRALALTSIAVPRDLQVHGDDIARLESRIRVGQTQHALDEQSRARQ